jgi:hypothetical protein
MTQEELRQLVAEVQRRQCELDNVEVKAARRSKNVGTLADEATKF